MNQLELFTPTKIKNSINILSLFDGMSCGQIALNRIGIKYDNYYSSEIDKFAIAVTQHHYPNTIQLGDINNWPDWKLPKIDLIMGGSPCQGFSFAGKQLNFNDSRSKLFFKFVEILECHKPKYFLLENVRMKKEYQNVITEILGVEPILINSALVSAQNRNRLYWTNIPNVIQPIDRGIVLKDILVEEVAVRPCKLIKPSKNSLCQQVAITNDIKGYDLIKRVYSPEGKSPTLTNCMGGNREPKVICNTQQINLSKESGGKQPYMQNRVFHIKGQSHSLTASFASRTNIGTHEEFSWRRLTPTECERLQTVPDNYTLVPWKNREMSNSQRYKMLGNGWTVDVIVHILKNMVFD